LLGWTTLPNEFARSLVRAPRRQTVASFLRGLPSQASNQEAGAHLANHLATLVEPPPRRTPKEDAASLTFPRTARLYFELPYWKTIPWLSAGPFVTKNDADGCAPVRDLDTLASALLRRHQKATDAAGLRDQALVGEMLFRWETLFAY